MNKWKIHFGWVIGLGILLLISIITFWLGGKGNEIVSYVSFASALVSIILALVAIFYSIIQNVSSQQNIGQMRTLISEASRVMTEKATSLEQHSLIMSRAAQLLSQNVQPSLPQTANTFYLNASTCSTIGLLGLYALASSEEKGKSFVLLDLLKHFIPEENVRLVVHNYILGLLIGFSCFFEVGSISTDLVNVKANKLPPDFKDYINEHIIARTKVVSSLMKKLLQEGKQGVDAYFQAV